LRFCATVVTVVCCAGASAAMAGAAGDPSLVDAIARGDRVAVNALIAAGVDVNAARGDGATPLFWAVEHDDRPIVEALIRAGARVNTADDTGVTPLYVACSNQDARMVETLLTSGTNPNATLLNGETPLMNCARTGNAASVKALIAAGAEVDARERARDQTALMWAAAEAHPDVVRVLIDAGADIRARSRTYPQIVSGEGEGAPRIGNAYTVQRGGSTPLLFAAGVGDEASARLLIAAGADPNDALADGMSAVILAAYNGQPGVGLLLLDEGADPNADAIGYTALHAAILRADSNRSLSPGLTAVIERASRGTATELDLVKGLLAHGAHPNARMTRGTPIRRQTADYVLPASRVGITPYLLAAAFLESDIMRVLARGGADPAVTMPDGTSALMLAAGTTAGDNRNRRGVAAGDGGKMEDERTVIETVRVALESGADVNAVNRDGRTAMHASAAMGYTQVIELLAEKGANINARDKDERTPLALASRAGQRRPTATSFDPTDRRSTVALLRRLGASQ
jgi:uncharacterized protein